ncbi:hypothetical protein Zm00014a_013962 [Zea mays]|jgi:hypothetical protein|uniref:Uncharacterized protein n=1 Tax=Zea mays TaxID=4577 RepID=A0A3L6G2B4_MAIZE|nr:hypothetical protein Zm00014a_013962 [Zea mays]
MAMLLPEEAMQRWPSCLAKHRAMDDKHLGRVVRPRSIDQADGVHGGDDDGDVNGGASRSVVATTSRHKWTCRRRGTTQAGVLVTPQAMPVAPSKKMRKLVLLKPMSRTCESTGGGRRKPDL